MDALLLALVLGLLLEQGAASQKRVSQLGDSAIPARRLLPGLIVIVLLNAALAATLGALVADLIGPDARLLFLAIALLIGGLGLLFAMIRWPREQDSRPFRHPLSTMGLLALRRSGENGSLAVTGIAVFTGAPVLTAAGAVLGGIAALLPAYMLGRRYERVVPLRVMQGIAGTIMISAGMVCAAGALRLLAP